MSESVEEMFERALEAILARVLASAGPQDAQALAVAYSGGLDSTVLLHLVHAFAARRGLRLFAFHVDHGLSPNARDWAEHCALQCARLGIGFDSRSLALAVGRNIEQEARHARYAALGALCRQHSVVLLLTAHHQDDQAETVLLQLLRGAGVAGLSGMEAAGPAPELLGDGATWIGRPLLGLTRLQLQQWAEQCELAWIEDESNRDARYTRNHLRQQITPRIGQAFPGYQARIARAAHHAAEAQAVLTDMAALDMQQCADGEGLDLDALRGLSEARLNNLLRYWFARHGLRMPTTAWLAQLRVQAFAAADDARVRITHPDCEVWRYRKRLMLVERIDERVLDALPQTLHWDGQGSIHVPAFGGWLEFTMQGEGVDAGWLRGQTLTIRHRSGGERLKPARNRP
ncbi:MAG TPA: tRNA lysidine(34) synthetase TilS, partial [Noviherbaspirillum sp.]|nr:tRNA lysidine(34) synthetase TilS [Noviherbaspirillum sp.]